MSHYRQTRVLPVRSALIALSHARNVLASDMDVALAGTGVTSSHVGVLLLLSRDIAHSSVGLSRRLSIDAGFVTRLVDRLEGQGLVQRARDSQDRRVVNLTLTEQGQNVAARVAEIVPDVLNRRLSGFSRVEFATLCRLVGKLLDQ